jgi:hypothetical protein
MIYNEYDEFKDIEILPDGKGIKLLTENHETTVR